MALFGKKHSYTSFAIARDRFAIACRRFGPKDPVGKPPVIVSHGFMGTQKTTEDYAAKFAEWGYTAYTFDFVGGAPRNSSTGSMADMSVMTEKQDLFTVMDHVLSETGAQKVILMGCSQGGFVSALAASEKPQLVDKLVLFYPALCIPDDSRSGKMMFFRFDPGNVPAEVKLIGRLKISHNYITEMQDFDPFESACLFPGDTLIVHGTKDKIVDINYSKCAYTAFCRNSGAENKHFFEIQGGAHGFSAKHDIVATEALKQFLDGLSEVITVDVKVLKTRTVQSGELRTKYIPFEGGAKSRFFAGNILPGAVDTWKWQGKQLESCCASYVLSGFDLKGQPCHITINNRSKDGRNWQPEVFTDSKALDFINTQQCSAVFEPRKGGPVIHIFAKA